MPNMSKGRKSQTKFKSFRGNDEFLSRISKTLYYSKRPVTDCLSLPVTEFAAELFTGVKCGRTLERLDVEEASRISRNACVSPCSFVLALLYIERLKDCNAEYLQRVAPSELFLVTLMVASKFLQDDGEEDEVYNAEWAKSGDLTIQQVNLLEKEFLSAIDWSVFVHNKDFWERLHKLESDLAYKEGNRRGWFSYTELNCLINTVQLFPVIQAFLSVSTVCLAAYVAGIATILGSVMLASHLPGTVFTSRRLSRCNSLSSDVYYKGFSECESSNLKTDSEILLPTNNTIPTMVYNNSHLENIASNDPDLVEFPTWDHWSESTGTFLSNLDLQAESIKNHNKVFQDVSEFYINTEPLEADLFLPNKEELVTIFNRREVDDRDFKLSLQNWRHYVSFISPR
ncbi:protein CNPPD1 [Leptopilina heterotoma]|uniref:protein CNPPD1 n=1 Tax=Leptopilina heterotoma TaxID=63436 RepID=UPI001CA9AD12|nr:protein CNPPD1 [Leptopilina heterotoma]